MYPIIRIYHRLYINNGNKVSRDIHVPDDRIWWYNHVRHATTENMTTMRKVDTSDLMMIMKRVINDIISDGFTPSYRYGNRHTRKHGPYMDKE